MRTRSSLPPLRPLLLAGLVALLIAGGTAPSASAAAPAPLEELTVHVIPAPRPLRWSHPRALALSAVANKVAFRHRDKKRGIGHVFVHLKSETAGREEMTGMTTRGATEDIDLILEDDYGLGVLGADMTGRLESAEDLRAEIAERSETGLIATLRYRISPEASARLLQFLDGFRARGHADHYGGANRPRYGEGGGCSAFGLAFLELAGLMEEDFDQWRVDFRIPRRFYGGPLTGLRAPLRRVLALGRRWAREDEPHVDMGFWDPTLMYQWIRETWRRERRAPSGRWEIESEDERRGLYRDAREVPVPQEPIWLQHPPGTPHPYGRQPSVRRDQIGTLSEDDLHWVAPTLIEILRSFGETVPSLEGAPLPG